MVSLGYIYCMHRTTNLLCHLAATCCSDLVEVGLGASLARVMGEIGPDEVRELWVHVERR